jgi:hypothetical protein
MERRALIAVIISVLILVLYQEFVMKRLYGPHPGAAPPESAQPPAAPSADDVEKLAAKPAARRQRRWQRNRPRAWHRCRGRHESLPRRLYHHWRAAETWAQTLQ